MDDDHKIVALMQFQQLLCSDYRYSGCGPHKDLAFVQDYIWASPPCEMY